MRIMKARLALTVILSLVMALCLSGCASENQNDARDSTGGTADTSSDIPGETESGDNRGRGMFTVTCSDTEDYVVYADGEQEDVDDGFIPIFINGELVRGYSAQMEGDQIKIPESDLKSAYGVDLGGGWNAEYYLEDSNPESASLIIYRSAVYLDEDGWDASVESPEDGLEIAREVAQTGLENYSKSLKANLEDSGEDSSRFDADLERIGTDIDDMSYIGEVSRYYIYDMNVYRVFVDRENEEVYFNYSTGLGEYSVPVDVNDSGLFTPLYIVG